MIRTVPSAQQLVRDFGTCLNFVNATDIIQMGTSNQYGSSFYFSAWVKWSGLNEAFQSLFAKRNTYAAEDLMFDLNLIDTTGMLTVDSITSYVQFSYKFPIEQWTHIVWVHDVAGSKDKLYINAQLVSNQAIGTLGTGTTAPVTIGGDQSPGQQNFNGKIDEVSIGTFAASQAQVDDIFYRSIYATSNVWTILKLNEGSGTDALDSSGNSNDGTITGATYATDKVITTRTLAQIPSTFAQVQNKTLHTTATSPVVITPTSALTQGNLVVIGLKVNSGGTVSSATDNAGTPNTYVVLPVKAMGASNLYLVYGVQVTGGATTVSITLGSAVNVRSSLGEYSGNAATNATAYDTTSNGYGSGTSLSVASFSPAANGELVVAVAGDNNGTGTYTAGANYTLGGATEIVAQEYRLASSGAETTPMDYTISGEWAMIAAAFKTSNTVRTVAGARTAIV